MLQSNSPSTSSLSNLNSNSKLRDRIRSPPPLSYLENNNINFHNDLIPTPLASTSTSTSILAMKKNPREDRELSIDGSFVETTSASAAKALAKYYGNQGGEEFAVQSRIDERGRTVYRIRPRSQPSSNPEESFDSTVHVTSLITHSSNSPASASSSSPNPTFNVQNPSPRKPSNSSPNISAKQWVLRTSKSIPLLRNVRSNSASPTTRTNFNLDDTLQLPPSPNSFLSSPNSPAAYSSKSAKILRKSGSTPTLSANSQRIRTKSSLANLNAKNSNTQGDILGRLLGWNEDEDRNGSGKRIKKTSDNRMQNSLRNITLGVQAESTIKGLDLKGKGVEIDNSTTVPSEFLSPPLPTIRIRSDSLPSSFIPTYNLPSTLLSRSNTITAPIIKSAEQSSRFLRGPTSRSMREAASSETIRMPKESSIDREEEVLEEKKRKRFQNLEIFDAFQILDSTQSNNSSIITEDPRFVIWTTKDSNSQPPSPPSIPPLPSIHSGSFTNRRASEIEIDLGSPSFGNNNNYGGGSPVTSSSSRRWSLRDSRRPQMGSSPATSVRESVSSSGGGNKEKVNSRMLMAATVERLVAELTSKIEVELLCGFFLTFRSFVRPLDLLRLLITRFSWAMLPTTSPEDDAGRRIVRVRTFVVIRHWLLNFFADDFIPDRKLRSTLTDWLNSSSKEHRIKESPKDQRLIKGLKKLVKKLKEIHLALGPSETAAAAKALADNSGLLQVPGLNSVAEGSEGIAKDTLDEDVDLELEGISPKSLENSTAIPLSPTLPRPSNSTRAGIPSSAISSPISQQYSSATTQNHILPHSTQQNVITKSLTSAFKKLIGKSPSSNPSSFNLHSNYLKSANANEEEEFDLLRMKGGLSKYLAFHGIEERLEEAESELPSTNVITNETLYTFPSLQPPSPSPRPSPQSISGLGIVGALENNHLQSSTLPSPSFHNLFEPKLSPPPSPFIPRGGISNESPNTYDSKPSFSPLSDTVFFLPQRPQSGRIELDDVDLSDEDEDVIEVKRTLKRLPAANNLRLASTLKNLGNSNVFRRSIDSISSYGSPRIPSFTNAVGRESMVDSDEDVAAGVQVVPNFVLDGLEDSSDEEVGDVEAALRRLEGIVVDSKEQEKARKVERQMEKSLRMKLAAAATIAAADNPSEEAQVRSESRRSSNVASSVTSSVLSSPSPQNFTHSNFTNPREAIVIEEEPAILIPRDQPNLQLNDNNNSRAAVLKPSIPRKVSLSKLFSPSIIRPLTRTEILPPIHRSFVLFCRTEVLAQQFCLIERDMLRVLGWQELVGGSWRDTAPAIEVLDWEVYLKERRVEDLKARVIGDKVHSNSVQAICARFNLTANWVCSEIVLTANLEDRAALVGKFIRLAFKCYCQSNFQTLSQIIHALQSPDIERLTKTWARVASWEIRKFKNLKLFVSHFKNFKLLREVTDNLISEYGPPGQRGFTTTNDNSRISSARGIKTTGCIPFLGIFLRDLTSNAELPTFLDPTSINSPAVVDESGSLLSTSNPTAFSKLSPLPNNLSLQPLVNVNKQRMLANLVQKVLAFQEFSEFYPYEAEPNLYFKCLKLRCLNPNIIKECSLSLQP